MSDRLDDTLRTLARVDAPADFARQVGVALEAGSPAPSAWPRLAAVAAAVLLVAGAWVMEHRGGGAFAPRGDQQRRAESLPPRVSEPRRAEARPPQVSEPRRAEALPPQVSEPRRAEARPPQLADHDRALPALAQLDTIGPESLVSVPVMLEAREVTALTAIAPIEIPALGADEGERR